MQKKNNKGVIALIIVLVLAAAALVICQINKPETQQGSSPGSKRRLTAASGSSKVAVTIPFISSYS